MSEWKEYKLGEIADIQNGFAFKSKDFSKQGIPIIKIKNIVPPSVVFEEVSYFDREIDSNLQKYLIKKGDFLIASIIGRGKSEEDKTATTATATAPAGATATPAKADDKKTDAKKPEAKK